MDDFSNKKDPFSGVEIVAVIGGTIDCAGNLRDDVKICRVVQIGESDILVADTGSYTERIRVVPKDVCIPISTSYERLVTARTSIPELGDLVMYHGKLDWKDKSATQITGILCELTYRVGTPSRAKLLSGGEMKEVEFSELLVLQKKVKK